MVDWIDDRQRLSDWAARARGAARLALDCEANGFHAYRPRLCLLQLARETERGVEVALVDPLALGEGVDILRPLLEDPRVEKILHGAANDVRLLDRDAGLHLRGLLDTEIAARLLGRERSGLAALSEELAGQRLTKSGQRLDWARRPLPDKALRYAAEDVAPLFAVRDALVDRIERRGRRDWLEEECRALEALRWREPPPPSGEDLLARTKGAGKIDGAARQVLRRLLVWREREAARRDVPAIHVAAPATLVRVAVEGPQSEEALARAGVDAKTRRRYGRALLEAVRRRSGGEGEASRGRPGRGPRKPPVDAERMAQLKRLRRERAAELSIDEGTLCPTEVLREIARSSPEGLGDLLGDRLRHWQARALGLVG
jgi:ribonuclease D